LLVGMKCSRQFTVSRGYFLIVQEWSPWQRKNFKRIHTESEKLES